MTDTTTIPSTNEGLREAAQQLQSKRGETPPDEVVVIPRDDEAEKNVSVRKAGAELADWRQKRAEEADAFDKALYGGPTTEATEADSEPADEAQIEQLKKTLAEYKERHGIGADNEALAEVRASREGAHNKVELARNLIESDFRSRFPEACTNEGTARLITENPQRYAEAVNYIQNAKQSLQGLQQQTLHSEIAYGRQFEDFGRAEDGEFVKLNYDQKDSKTQELQAADTRAAQELLRSVGVSDQEVEAMWHGAQGLNLRDRRAQTILLKAARFDMAQKRMRQGVGRAPAPPVMKPGTSGTQPSSGERAVAAAQESFRGNPSLRNAARALIAKRNSRG